MSEFNQEVLVGIGKLTFPKSIGNIKRKWKNNNPDIHFEDRKNDDNNRNTWFLVSKFEHDNSLITSNPDIY